MPACRRVGRARAGQGPGKGRTSRALPVSRPRRPRAARREGSRAMASPRTTRFGERLRRARQAAGLTQEALAERAGLSRRGINDLERGVRQTPRKDTVALLAAALGLSEADRLALEAAARRTTEPIAPAPS